MRADDVAHVLCTPAPRPRYILLYPLPPPSCPGKPPGRPTARWALRARKLIPIHRSGKKALKSKDRHAHPYLSAALAREERAPPPHPPGHVTRRPGVACSLLRCCARRRGGLRGPFRARPRRPPGCTAEEESEGRRRARARRRAWRLPATGPPARTRRLDRAHRYRRWSLPSPPPPGGAGAARRPRRSARARLPPGRATSRPGAVACVWRRTRNTHEIRTRDTYFTQSGQLSG